ncbi:MAG: cadherin-like domain-containing protein [Candidatus Latescibacterota bacterium]
MVEFAGGTHTFESATLDGQGPGRLSAGTIDVAGASTVRNIEQTGGTLTGAADLTVNGLYVWTAGTMSGAGETVVAGGGMLRAAPGSGKYLQGRTLRVATGSTLEVTGAYFRLQGGASVWNEGILDVRMDGTALELWAAPARVVNTEWGTLRKGAGTATAAISVPLINQGGTIETASGTGTLQLAAADTLAGGTLSIASGTALELATGTKVLSGILSGQVQGSVRLVSGTLEIDPAGAELALSDSGFSWKGGSTIRGTDGRLTNSGMLKINGTGAQYLENATLLNAESGTVVLSAPYFRLASSTVENNGTFDIRGTSGVSHWSGTTGIGNSGTFQKSTGSGASTIGVDFNNQGLGGPGTVRVTSGTLDLQQGVQGFAGGHYEVSGTLKFLDADNTIGSNNIATLTLDGPAAQITSESGANALAGLAANASFASLVLKGGRSLTLGSFDNYGLVDVGPGSVFQTSGAYTQEEMGTLRLEVAGTSPSQHGRLAVGGVAGFAGTLQAHFVSGFGPLLGDTFAVATYASRTDTFSTVAADGGVVVATEYGPTALTLRTGSVANTPPTITAIADQVIPEDGSTGPLPFTVGDGQTFPDTLVLQATADRPDLVSSIGLGGSSANRTVTVDPATDSTGVIHVFLTVSDGSLAAADTFVVQVTPVNDPPVVDARWLTVAAGGTTVVGPNAVQATDVDDGPGHLVYTLTAEPAAGALRRAGETLHPEMVFSQADVNASQVTYQHGDSAQPDTLRFVLRDSSGAAADPVVLPVDVVAGDTTAPTITPLAGVTMAEDATHWVILEVDDGDGLPVHALIVTAHADDQALLPDSSLSVELGEGWGLHLAPAHNASGSATVTVTVSDGLQSTSTQFTVTVEPVNDAPDVYVGSALVAVGDTVGLLPSMLSLEDPDSTPAERQFTVVTPPMLGELQLEGQVLGAQSSFTQADVLAGHLRYVHTGSTEGSDAFYVGYGEAGGTPVGHATFTIEISGTVAMATEVSPADVVLAHLQVGPGAEVQLFDIGLTGDGGAALEAVALTLAAWPTPQMLAPGDIAELRLYRSADAVLDPADSLLGRLVEVPFGTPAGVPCQDGPDSLDASVPQFYLVSAVLGVHAFDGHGFQVAFADGGVGTTAGPVGTGVVTPDTGGVEVEVVADRLVFARLPAPLAFVAGDTVDFQVVPLVEAQDGQGNLDRNFADLVQLHLEGPGEAGLANHLVMAVGGAAEFAGLAALFPPADSAATYQLVADDEPGGPEGDLPAAVLPQPLEVAPTVVDHDGVLVAATQVQEPVPLPTTADAAERAVPVFDFAIHDGGGGDGLPLKATEVVLRTWGNGPFAAVDFVLDGPGAAGVHAVRDEELPGLHFGGLQIEVSDGDSASYVLRAHFLDPNGLVEGQTLGLGIDADADLLVVPYGTQTSGSNTPVETDVPVAVTATQLVFTAQPGGAVHDRVLEQQPVVAAVDAHGNVDQDVNEPVTLSVGGGSSLRDSTATAQAGVATFGGLAVRGAGSGRSLGARAISSLTGTSAPFDVARAPAAVTLSGLSVPYTATPVTVTATTTPAGLPVSLTYGGAAAPPVGPGSFAVAAVVTSPDYAGEASGTLLIAPPPAPTAGLGATPIQGNPPLRVTFTDASTGYVGSWYLETGDDQGTVFTDRLAGGVGTYSLPGPHEALLTVRGPGGRGQARVAITVNGPPKPAAIPPQSTPEDQVLVVSLAGRDPDPGTWSVSGADPGLIAAAQVAGEALRLTPVANAAGSDVVTVTRTNAHGLTASQDVAVTWTPVDDPPTIAPPLAALHEGAEDTPVAVAGRAHAADIDTDPAALEWSASGFDARLVARAQGGSAGVVFTPVPDAYGETPARIVLRDPNSRQEAAQEVTVRWAPVNDPPSAPLALFPPDAAGAVPLAPVLAWQAADRDGDALRYDVVLSSGASPVAQGTGLSEPRFAPGVLQPGTAYSWTVTARDAQGSAQASFSFTTEADRRPPVLSEVRAAATDLQATVSWLTDEPASARVTYASVPSDSGAPQAGEARGSGMGTAHQVSLEGLQPSTWYQVVALAADAAGNQGRATTSFRTLATPDRVAPRLLMRPLAEGITTESAVVHWTTDELCDSRVRYGVRGEGLGPVLLVEQLVSDHRLKVSGLQAATEYEYEVGSTDAAGNAAGPWAGTFATPARPDSVPPAFVEGPAAHSITDSAATIRMRASEVVAAQVRFDADADPSDGRLAVAASVGDGHQIPLTGLAPQTEYRYQVTLTDQTGNTAASAVRSFTTRAAPDLQAPAYIAPPAIEALTDATAVVSLAAGEPVRVQVLVAPAADPAATVLRESSELRPRHAVLLTGLEAETDYLYEVRMQDGAGNAAAPASGRFRTRAAPDAQPPRLEGPFAEGIGSETAGLVFRTDEPSTALVQHGPAAGAPDSVGVAGGRVTLAELAREHRVQLTRLAADTPYLATVTVEDAAGNAALPAVVQFRTRRAPDIEPPQVLTGPDAEGITPTEAILSVRFSEPVEVAARYAPSPDLGGALSVETGTRARDHRLPLAGLEPGTRYWAEVVGEDAAGLASRPARVELTTPRAADTTPPQFVSVPAAVQVTAVEARIAFALDEPALAELVVSATPAGLEDGGAGPEWRWVQRSAERRRDHQFTVTGLAPQQQYYFRATATNTSDLSATSGGDFRTPADVAATPPRIVNGPAVEQRTDQSVTLYLRTDRSTLAEVTYQPSDGSGEERREQHADLQSEHTLVLTGLTPATEYGYSVTVRDAAGLAAPPAADSFATRAAPDTAAPRLLGPPTVADRQHDGATLVWLTDEPADSYVRVWPLADPADERRAGEGADVREHRVTVTNLAGGESYGYEVASTDAAGNGPTRSAPFTFITPASPDTVPPRFSLTPVVKGRTHQTAVLSWETDEPASARVLWGLTADHELGGEARTDLSRQREWTLTGLAPASAYPVQIEVDDLGRNGPTTYLLTVETLAAPDLVAPRILTGPLAVTTTQSEAVIEWLTDEPADSRLTWELDGHGDSVVDPEFRRDHRVVLSGLVPGSTYTYTAGSQDMARNPVTTSAPQTFTTRAEADTDPPSITFGPVALDVTETRATITWSTDEAATTTVDYGHPDYEERVEQGALLQEHVVTLSGLEPGETYHYRVTSLDLAGNAVTTDPSGGQLHSVDHTFTTLSERDRDPPNFEQTPTVSWTDRTAVIEWLTDEVSDSRVDWVGNGTADFVADNALVRQHSLTVTGLVPRTGYRIMVTSVDRAGNRAVWGSVAGPKHVAVHLDAAGKVLQPPGGAGQFVTDTFADTRYPSIVSGPVVREKTTGAVTIEWQTDELADSFVRFGGEGGLASVVGSAQDVAAHRITLTGLRPGTTYQYRVESTDPSGNGATQSALAVVTTSSEADLQPPRFLRQPETVAATERELVIGWETDEPAVARVEYRAGGAAPMTRQAIDRQTRQQVTLPNLAPQTEYRIRVWATDASQNEAEADVELRLRTEPAPDLAAPRLVGEVQVESVTDRTAVITWQTDELADSFVDYDNTPYLGRVVGAPAYVLQHRVVLTGLTPRTQYYYRAGSRDRAANGPVESRAAVFRTAAEADTTPPPVPQGLSVQGGSRANLVVWQASAATDLAGYSLYREDAGGRFTPIASRLVATRYLDAGLVDGRQYHYRVTALDGQSLPNESVPSEVAAGTPGEGGAPGAPTILGLALGAAAGQPVVLIGNAAAASGHALTYTVHVATGPTFADAVARGGGIPEGAGTTRWRVPRALQPARTYWWRARATDGQLDGPWSQAVALRPQDAAQQWVSADVDGDGEVGLTDFFQVAAGFGGAAPQLDLDGDGQVGRADLSVLGGQLGRTGVGQARPARRLETAGGTRLEVQAQVTPERRVAVELRLEPAGIVTGYGCRLGYDPRALRFLGLSGTSGALLGPEEISLRLLRQEEGSLLLAEHLQGKLAGAPLAPGARVVLHFALQERPLGTQIRVEEGYITRGGAQAAVVEHRAAASLVPFGHALFAPYPNPFNPVTTIPVALAGDGEARLVLYDALGQVVRVWDLRGRGPGYHAVEWDGEDGHGKPAATGVYLVRLLAGDCRQTRKLLLVR